MSTIQLTGHPLSGIAQGLGVYSGTNLDYLQMQQYQPYVTTNIPTQTWYLPPPMQQVSEKKLTFEEELNKEVDNWLKDVLN